MLNILRTALSCELMVWELITRALVIFCVFPVAEKLCSPKGAAALHVNGKRR